MGLEAIKSSTPAPCRQMIKDAVKIILTGTNDEIIQYIDDCRKKFNTLPIEDISFPRGVSDAEKYKSHSDIYVKGTPGNTRGVLLFNH